MNAANFTELTAGTSKRSPGTEERGMDVTKSWKVCPGDASCVSVPGVVKPIACGSQERARMIAATPELVESLRNLVGLAKMRGGNLHEYGAAIKDAEAALSKAGV